jgi:hypothetical protein
MKEAMHKNKIGSKIEPLQRALTEVKYLIMANDIRINVYVAACGEEHHYLDGKKKAFIEVQRMLLKLKKAL